MRSNDAAMSFLSLIFVYFLFSDGFCSNIDPKQATRDQWIKPKRPLILVGGYGGNTLYREPTQDGSWGRIWVNQSSLDSLVNDNLSNVYTIQKTFGSWQGLTQHVYVSRKLRDVGSLSPESHHMDGKFEVFDTMINYLVNLGYKEDVTLFGFSYDWRNSLMDDWTNLNFLRLIHKICESHEKVDIISHNSGGLLVQSLFVKYFDIMDMRVGTWIAIGTPWDGTPTVLVQLISGYNFLLYQNSDGPKLDLKNSTSHNVAVNWPIAYELLPNFSKNWANFQKTAPRVCYRKSSDEFCIDNLLGMKDLLRSVNRLNTISVNGKEYPAVFNREAWERGKATRELLSTFTRRLSRNAKKRNFYNIFGANKTTPYVINYTHPISSYEELIGQTPEIGYASGGDGFVPLSPSQSTPFFKNVRYEGDAGNVEMLRSASVLQAVKQILGLSCRPLGDWGYVESGQVKRIRIPDYVEVVPLRDVIDDRASSTYDAIEYNGIKGHFDEECTQLTFSVNGSDQFVAQRIPKNICQPGRVKEENFENGHSYYPCMLGEWDMSHWVKQNCNPPYILVDESTCFRVNESPRNSVVYPGFFLIFALSLGVVYFFVSRFIRLLSIENPANPSGTNLHTNENPLSSRED